MKIQGTFLTSRAGRRIFWTLLLAAAIPLALFGVGTYHELSEHFAAQARRQEVQVSKFAGMGVLDRLVVARTVLEIMARTGRADADSQLGNHRGRVLVAAAHLDSRGVLLDGNAALWQRWHDIALQWDPRSYATATLALGRSAASSESLPVLMAVRDVSDTSGLWIGEVDRDFLFGELSAEASGVNVCVFDAHGRPVHCPGWAAREQPAVGRGTKAVTDSDRAAWKLFLRSDFGVDDWTLVKWDLPSDAAAGTASMARFSALGAVVTLLLVVMLSLVQVRRTMVPLERLIAGTRRLSGRDYAARVEVGHDDEFGELASAFNHMAARVGHQVEALHVQSEIDREILGGLDVPRVLQRVAQRLEALVPGGTAAVVEFVSQSPSLARAHRAQGTFTMVAASVTDDLRSTLSSAAQPVSLERMPRWLSASLPVSASHVLIRCAQRSDELLAILAVATHDTFDADADTTREIAELCDRVSVTLASADRERRLVERATCDSLTGLANRSGLYGFIDTQLTAAVDKPFTVLFIDLDRFKEVNDAMGHQAGDELLREIASRLQMLAPSGALIARPGGDEFVVVLPGTEHDAQALAYSLCVEIAKPVALAGRTMVVGASVGMARHPDHGRSAAELMRRADMAMYSAKSDGGDKVAWFELALDTRLAERTSLLEDLRQALERNEFEVHYQPRIDVQTKRVSGAEALLRWRHHGRGLVLPHRFIELLEETAQIHGIGLWVMETACKQLATWRRQGINIESIAVNLSARQLHASGFVEQVLAILVRSGLAPSNLELEVTESIFMGDSAAAIAVLQRLRQAGLRIALDDFGTGYSSLSYLHKLPIGILKVDRSFVVDLGQRASSMALTRSILALARALDMRVVAEGVETQMQADLLSELGCDELQGYLFSRPLAAADFAAFTRTTISAVQIAAAEGA